MSAVLSNAPEPLTIDSGAEVEDDGNDGYGAGRAVPAAKAERPLWGRKRTAAVDVDVDE